MEIDTMFMRNPGWPPHQAKAELVKARSEMAQTAKIIFSYRSPPGFVNKGKLINPIKYVM
jgi:hypothetical protein